MFVPIKLRYPLSQKIKIILQYIHTVSLTSYTLRTINGQLTPTYERESDKKLLCNCHEDDD